MSATAVLIPCSRAKLTQSAPALDLYTGSTFRLARAAALALTGADSVFVVSGRYGVVPAARRLSPYDQVMPADGCSQLMTQPEVVAAVNGHAVVVLLLPTAYRRCVAAVGVRVDLDPFSVPNTGIGRQRALLVAVAKRDSSVAHLRAGIRPEGVKS